MNKCGKNSLLITVTASIAFFSGYVARMHPEYVAAYWTIPGCIIVQVYNSGSLLTSLLQTQLFDIAHTILLFCVALYSTYRSCKQHSFGWIFLASGCLSNGLEKMLWGNVFDWLLCTGICSFWPPFTLADIYITVGLLAIGYCTIKEEYEAHRM